MKKLLLISITIVCCALFTSNAPAQSEKLSIPIMPQPNQTTRLTLTEDVNIETSGVGKSSKLIIKSIMRLIQKSGPVDDQGRFEVEITCEDLSGELTRDGHTFLIDEGMKKVIGKKYAITYNREGRMLDVKAPGDPANSTKSFGRMQEFIYGNIPKGELSIGEIAVSPLNNMDWASEMFEKGTLKLQGDMKSKLVAAVNDDGYRIAKFDQTYEAKSIQTADKLQPGTIGVSSDYKFSGTGTLEINLDKSLLKAFEMKMNIGSALYGKIKATDPLMPVMEVKGTINVSVSVKL